MTVATLSPTQRLALLLAFHALSSSPEAVREHMQREVWMGLRPPPGWVGVDALVADHVSFQEALKTLHRLQRAGYVTLRRCAGLMIYTVTPPGREAGEMIDADPLLSVLADAAPPCVSEERL